MWAEIGLGVLGCAAVLAGVGLVANRYESPITHKPTGIAYPVVILIGITLLMTYVARRRRFGRYVYAYGGNPEAALQLERVWDDLTRRLPFLTVCFYSTECFGEREDPAFFPDICAPHSAVCHADDGVTLPSPSGAW
jgi:hypothetical protein